MVKDENELKKKVKDLSKKYKSIGKAEFVRSGSVVLDAILGGGIPKGVFISFDAVDGYIWAVMPEEYTPTVSMNLIKAEMEYDSTVLINGKRYKIWKSVDTHAGTFNLSLS